MKALYGLIAPVNKALLTAGVGALSLPGLRQGAARTLGVREPLAAVAAGEELVTRRRRVLAITCHPDDLAFFCGGTLARLTRSGGELHALVLGDGEKGGSQAGLGARRRREEAAVGRVPGYSRCGTGPIRLHRRAANLTMIRTGSPTRRRNNGVWGLGQPPRKTGVGRCRSVLSSRRPRAARM